MLTVLEREFLEKLARHVTALPAGLTAASLEEMNDGLCPQWQIAAVGSLMTGGLIEERGADGGGHPRYAVTAVGRAALKQPPPEPPAVRGQPYPRTGYARPASRRPGRY